MTWEYTDKSNLKDCFSNYGFEIINIEKCIEYLKKHFCLFTYKQIIDRFRENNEIKCPIRYLDCDMIYSEIQFGYFEINNNLFLDIDEVFENNEVRELVKQNIIKKY